MENLCLSIVNIFTVDWVTCSFGQSDVYSVISMLGFSADQFSYAEKYSWGYPCTASFGNIRIFYNPDDFTGLPRFPNSHKGCCLNMSGQGCREFETHSPTFSWADLFSRFELLNGRFTRLDLAYDDRTGVIPLPRLAIDIAERNFIGHAKQSQRLYSDDIENDIQGLTVYVGSRKSDLYIRIYDKAAERGYKSSELHWIRVEIQMRNDRAIMAARSVACDPNIGNVFAGILANYLRILQPTNDSNKSRWTTADYWQQILHDVSALPLTMPGIEYNFRKAEFHFVKQYHQFLYAYQKIYGDAAPEKLFSEVMSLCDGEDIKEKYLAVIRNAASIIGVPDTTDVDQALVVQVESINTKLMLENKSLMNQIEVLRGIVADLKYRDAETMSFNELLGLDPNCPF